MNSKAISHKHSDEVALLAKTTKASADLLAKATQVSADLLARKTEKSAGELNRSNKISTNWIKWLTITLIMVGLIQIVIAVITLYKA